MSIFLSSLPSWSASAWKTRGRGFEPWLQPEALWRKISQCLAGVLSFVLFLEKGVFGSKSTTDIIMLTSSEIEIDIFCFFLFQILHGDWGTRLPVTIISRARQLIASCLVEIPDHRPRFKELLPHLHEENFPGPPYRFRDYSSEEATG